MFTCFRYFFESTNGYVLNFFCFLRVKDCIDLVEPEDDISCDLPDEITMEFSESLMMTLIANGNSGNIRNSNKNIV